MERRNVSLSIQADTNVDDQNVKETYLTLLEHRHTNTTAPLPVLPKAKA